MSNHRQKYSPGTAGFKNARYGDDIGTVGMYNNGSGGGVCVWGGGRVHAAGVTEAFAAPGVAAFSPADLDFARCERRRRRNRSARPIGFGLAALFLRNIKYNKQHNNHLIINQTTIKKHLIYYYLLYYIIYYYYYYYYYILLLYILAIIFYQNIKNPFFISSFRLENQSNGRNR